MSGRDKQGHLTVASEKPLGDAIEGFLSKSDGDIPSDRFSEKVYWSLGSRALLELFESQESHPRLRRRTV